MSLPLEKIYKLSEEYIEGKSETEYNKIITISRILDSEDIFRTKLIDSISHYCRFNSLSSNSGYYYEYNQSNAEPVLGASYGISNTEYYKNIEVTDNKDGTYIIGYDKLYLESYIKGFSEIHSKGLFGKYNKKIDHYEIEWDRRWKTIREAIISTKIDRKELPDYNHVILEG